MRDQVAEAPEDLEQAIKKHICLIVCVSEAPYFEIVLQVKSALAHNCITQYHAKKYWLLGHALIGRL